MNIWLYDEREKFTLDFSRYLGSSTKFFLTRKGKLRIGKTEFLWSLLINLSRKEMEALRDRLNQILGSKQAKAPSSKVMAEVEEILKTSKH